MELSQLHLTPIDAVTMRQKSFVFMLTHLEPYSIYHLLKQHVGVPNAKTSKHSYWCYECEVPTGFVRISDWKLYGCSITIYPDDEQSATADLLYDELIALFNKDRNNQNKTNHIKAMAKDSTRFLLQNPYRVYFNTGSDLLKLAENMPVGEQQDTLCRSAFFQFLSAFEGLLNLLYDLYLRSTIRTNKELAESVIKMPLDHKIAMAPIYCICFNSDKLTIPEETYKRYKAIRTLRNNFIHANLTVAMKTTIVKDGELTFLLQPNQTKEYQLPLVVSNLNVDHLHFTQATIKAMKSAIIHDMHPTYRYDFDQALERDSLVVEQDQYGNYMIRTEL